MQTETVNRQQEGQKIMKEISHLLLRFGCSMSFVAYALAAPLIVSMSTSFAFAQSTEQHVLYCTPSNRDSNGWCSDTYRPSGKKVTLEIRMTCEDPTSATGKVRYIPSATSCTNNNFLVDCWSGVQGVFRTCRCNRRQQNFTYETFMSVRCDGP